MITDWRLPTLAEAMSLMEPKKQGGLHFDPIFDQKQGYIWTADKHRSAAAWAVNFDYGSCYLTNISHNNGVRAVCSEQ